MVGTNGMVGILQLEKSDVLAEDRAEPNQSLEKALGGNIPILYWPPYVLLCIRREKKWFLRVQM